MGDSQSNMMEHTLEINSRPTSRMSLSQMSTASNERQLKKLLKAGSEDTSGKVKQTLQMITMVVVPIIALLTLTSLSLVTTLQTSSTANDAKSQLQRMLEVSLLCD